MKTIFFSFIFLNRTVLLCSGLLFEPSQWGSISGAPSLRVSTAVTWWLPLPVGHARPFHWGHFILEHSSIPSAQLFSPTAFQSGGRREPWLWFPWVLELHTLLEIWVYYASITEWWKKSNSTYIFKSRHSDADFSFRERLPKMTVEAWVF